MSLLAVCLRAAEWVSAGITDAIAGPATHTHCLEHSRECHTWVDIWDAQPYTSLRYSSGMPPSRDVPMPGLRLMCRNAAIPAALLFAYNILETPTARVFSSPSCFRDVLCSQGHSKWSLAVFESRLFRELSQDCPRNLSCARKPRSSHSKIRQAWSLPFCVYSNELCW
jgi:hypothetical protein